MMVQSILLLIGLVIALIVFVPALVLFIECVATIGTTKKEVKKDNSPLPSYKILMPAHNESAVIRQTLQKLLTQISNPADIVVVADNCTDATAELARLHGATVLERFNEKDRGKGFALDYGLTQLSSNPPSVILMIDADTTFETQAGLEAVIRLAEQTGRPIQSVYLQQPPADPTLNDLVSAFAFRTKNLVRPLGLFRLGQPCLLTGSGMAFPWDVIRSVPLASGNIVEDMQLGFDLAIGGHAPLLSPHTLVWGELPQGEEVALTQRTRWEHGHIQTLLTQIPRLVTGAIKTKQVGLVALALDLLLPPLALFVLIWGASAIFTILLGLFGVWLPSAVSAVSGILLFVALFIAWAKSGKEVLPFSKLVAIPLYIAWKIPLYVRFLFNRESSWVRTDRESDVIDTQNS